jgi:hypothetical protein
MNLGDWLQENYPDEKKFKRIIDRIAYRWPEAPMPQVVSVVPNATVNELYVGLHQLSYTMDAKHGCF